MKKEDIIKHPALTQSKTFAQKAADILTNFVGSWKFIIIFFIYLFTWILLNGYIWYQYEFGAKPLDPYPFILLNLTLSCIAAIQAPIILMSQNRQNQKDRQRIEYDYKVDKKAEKEIESIKMQLDRIESYLRHHK